MGKCYQDILCNVRSIWPVTNRNVSADYKGSYVVDAKSLLGVCSMDTTNGCIVKINASEGQVEKFEEKIKEYTL